MTAGRVLLAAAATLMLALVLGGASADASGTPRPRSAVGEAAKPSSLISPTPNSAAGAATLAATITANPSWVTSASFPTVPATGTPNGTSNHTLGGLPTNGGTFAILTTGNVNYADDANNDGGTGDKLNATPIASRGNTAYDVTVLRINLTVPGTANCLGLDFKYFSEEFDEFVGTQYNDAFIAELDTSNWTTSGSTISAPNNFAFDPAGHVISVNSTGPTSVNAANAAGTTYDGATPLLTAFKQVTPGAHSLYLSIFDQGDAYWDSAVFLDNLRLYYVSNPATNCNKGALPPPKCQNANATIVGTGGNDTILGTPGNDVIVGLGGNDTILGAAGNDTICAGDGNDAIDGGVGNDVINGDAGVDTASFGTVTTVNSRVTANLTAGTSTSTDQGNDTLKNLESLAGSAKNDTLIGNAAGNSIDGKAGNDTILGLGGNDALLGGDGDDLLRGGAGNDSVQGGAGIDTVDYISAAGAVIANLSTGTASGGEGSDTLATIENILGSPFSDSLSGSSLVNDIRGGAGNDSLFGLAGNDTLRGEAGNDSLHGGDGNDTLDGGPDTDTCFQDTGTGTSTSCEH
ncbi:MAG: hypothetical protein QOE36_5 [Gaiellaceae bacterium]|jgi:Ca2+-binding RTX toxin-like protein|nr:hypothetical protein [Gaiellaceae bacterium]